MRLFAKCDHSTQDCTHRWHRIEEQANGLTHLLGALLGIVALVLLVVQASRFGSVRSVIGCAVFGASLIVTYTSSAAYHFVTNLTIKHHLRRVDHMSIYLLIAGSYTPFTLVSLYGPWGWSLFGVIWGLALIGFGFKLYSADKFEWISTLTYVLMGWAALVAIVPIIENLPLPALIWLIGGGVLYTVGVFFFLLETVPFAHTIWHLFVLGGSICHFFAVLFYVAPIAN
jgi:hemolysin III